MRVVRPKNLPNGAAHLLIAVVLVTALSSVAHAQNHGPALTVIDRTADFGAVRFDATDPRDLRISLLVRSSSAWALSALRDGAIASVAPNAAPIGQTDSLLVRGERSEYQRLRVGVPIAIATGGATSDAGKIIRMDLRLEPSFETPPGVHAGQIRFLMNGEIVAAAVAVSYSIEPVVTLLNEPEPFDSPLIDPTESSIYRFAPHTYVVQSNVGWVLEVSLAGPPQMTGSSEQLACDSLGVLSAKGWETFDVTSRPLIVATGGPTATEGQSVVLRLGVRIKGGEVGGTYSGEIRVKPRAIESSIQERGKANQ